MQEIHCPARIASSVWLRCCWSLRVSFNGPLGCYRKSSSSIPSSHSYSFLHFLTPAEAFMWLYHSKELTTCTFLGLVFFWPIFSWLRSVVPLIVQPCKWQRWTKGGEKGVWVQRKERDQHCPSSSSQIYARWKRPCNHSLSEQPPQFHFGHVKNRPFLLLSKGSTNRLLSSDSLTFAKPVMCFVLCQNFWKDLWQLQGNPPRDNIIPV